MATLLEADPLPLREDEAGGLRVGNSRVTVDSVLHAYLNGSTAEEIVYQYDVLDLADVHAVLAHYLRHRAEFDAYLERRRLDAERRRQESVERHGLTDHRERLLARLAAKESAR
jgi:uncharacterized protein (DUF433 family)